MEASWSTQQPTSLFHLPHVAVLSFHLLASPLRSWHQHLVAGSPPGSLTKYAQNYHFAALLLLLLWNAIFTRPSMSRHHLPLPRAGVSTLQHGWRCHIWTHPHLQLWRLNSVWQHHVTVRKTFNFQISRWDMKAAVNVFRSILYWLTQAAAITRAPEKSLLYLHKPGLDWKACLMRGCPWITHSNI